MSALGDSTANHRTIYEITSFACTWVALHPGVPIPAAGRHHTNTPTRWEGLKRRAVSTLGIAIAPEFMIVRAIGERVLARSLVNGYNQFCDEESQDPSAESVKKVRWTLTHGLFLLMDGFMLHNEQGEPIGPLTPKIVSRAMKTKELAHWPLSAITKEEIEDKSKGNFFTKLVVLIHTTWFIVVCVSRWSVGLPLVELEVITLAFAVMNIVTLAMWWDKPQDVNLPIPIAVPNSDMVTRLPLQDEITRSHRFLLQQANNGRSYTELFLRTLYLPFTIVTETYAIPVRVPCHALFFRLAIISVATIFASFHFCCWSTKFPSVLEGFLWRFSSVVYLIILLTSWLPLEFLLDTSFNLNLGLWQDPRKTRNLRDWLVMQCSLFLFPMYFFARVMLFTVAFSSLRSLPDNALLDVQWSRYIPHF